MASLIQKIRTLLFRGLARNEDITILYEQVHGLFQIQNAMAGQPVLRPLRYWSISPDAMVFVLANLQARQAPVVVEFGSGQSTLMLAAALKHRNGALLSVEHNLEYSALVQRQVVACGLSDHVQFLHSPLADSSDTVAIRSYDVSKLPNVGVDLALIDGPPSDAHPLTRWVPLRWAAHHLNPGGSVFLDDAGRDQERACLHRASIDFPNLRQVQHDAEKGLVELHDRASHEYRP